MHRAVALSLLFLLGCGNPTSPSGELSGTWIQPIDVPGSGFAFTIDQAGDSVHGTGVYAVEAGPGGTFQVRGSFRRPEVVLEFLYDNNRGVLHQEFRGHSESVGMKVLSLVGTVSTTGSPYPVTYIKR